MIVSIKAMMRRGEIVALAGLVGAGRTELALAISGDRPITSGTINVGGVAQKFHSPADAIAAGIGLAPEERKADALVMVRTVRDNIALAVLGRLSRFGFVNRRAERELAATYIRQLRIRTPSMSQLAQGLSGGNQQKVVLARWLGLADRIVVMQDGRVTGELTRAEATEERILTLAIADHISSEGALP
ncbi:MAG TPA: ATP-binding cassette domain-containing protein [Candidatus Limnocylindrales bacterium]